MKLKYLLFISLFINIMSSNAVDRVNFTYDEAGNRKSRKLITVQLRSAMAGTQVEEPAPVESPLGKRKVLVYPNPTKGALAVEVTGGGPKDKVDITLFNAQGVQLQYLQGIVGKTPVDMTQYASTWYILRVSAGQEVVEFKIIKQ